MKRRILFLTSIVFIVTLLVSSLNILAASDEVVEINGKDRFMISNAAAKYDMESEEGINVSNEFMCTPGARLTTLEEGAITMIVYMEENGDSVALAPDNHTVQELNEYGQFFDLPKGGSYTFDKNGAYYYDIQFADNTVAAGYINVDGGNAVIENTPATVVPEEPQFPEMSETISVVSKAQLVQIEEELAKIDAYAINGNNYIKLRDFAYYYSMLGNHTDKYFDVTWDGSKNAINLITGKAYTAVGGEGILNEGISALAAGSTSSVYLNGEYVPLKAYTINGNNYFKLRDLCEAMNISISWWPKQQIIYINNDYGYGTEFEEIAPM